MRATLLFAIATTFLLAGGAALGQARVAPTRMISNDAALRIKAAHLGLQAEEHQPVGQPPITRWDYREFSVYFEYDHVINSVRHHRPRTKEQQ